MKCIFCGEKTGYFSDMCDACYKLAAPRKYKKHKVKPAAKAAKEKVK